MIFVYLKLNRIVPTLITIASLSFVNKGYNGQLFLNRTPPTSNRYERDFGLEGDRLQYLLDTLPTFQAHQAESSSQRKSS